MTSAATSVPTPERQAYDRELQTVLERAIDRLPDSYRSVFVLRVVLEFHSIRQRIHDTRQSNQLQTEGWQVLRFLGPHVHRNSADCVAQLQNALGLPKEG